MNCKSSYGVLVSLLVVTLLSSAGIVAASEVQPVRAPAASGSIPDMVVPSYSLHVSTESVALPAGSVQWADPIAATQPITTTGAMTMTVLVGQASQQIDDIQAWLDEALANGEIDEEFYTEAMEGLNSTEAYLDRKELMGNLKELGDYVEQQIAQDPNCLPCAQQQQMLAQVMQGMMSSDPQEIAQNLEGLKGALAGDLGKMFRDDVKPLIGQVLEQTQGVLAGTSENMLQDALASGQGIDQLMGMLEQEKDKWPPEAYEQLMASLTNVRETLGEIAEEEQAEQEMEAEDEEMMDDEEMAEDEEMTEEEQEGEGEEEQGQEEQQGDNGDDGGDGGDGGDDGE